MRFGNVRFFPAIILYVLTTDPAVSDTLHPYRSPATVFSYTIPASTVGSLGYSLAGSFYYGNDAAMAEGIGGERFIRKLSNNQMIDPAAAQIINGGLDVTLGVHRLAAISFTVPYYYDIPGWGYSKQTIGDLTVSAKSASGGISSRPVRFGGRISVVLPTGNPEAGIFPRHVFYIKSDPSNSGERVVVFAHNKTYLHPCMLWSLDLRRIRPRLPLEIHFNTGAVFSDAKERFSIDGALAAALRPVRALCLSLELASETRPFVAGRSIADAFVADPLRFVPAASLDLPAGVTLRMSGEIGLSNGKWALRSIWYRNGYVYATKAVPFYAIALNVIYRGTLHKRSPTPDNVDIGGSGESGDRDGDNIPDSLDKCPTTPEDRDGFSDKDGCPDYDNDADGIPDSTDACPEEKGTEFNRGCPETGDLRFERTVLTAVAFEPGKSKIVSGSEILDKIFDAMQKAPASKIEFQVHTDNLGPSDSCRALSQKRADVLKLYLVAKGIRPDRIKALGMGSDFPVADNSTEEGRAKNRGVEVRRIE